MTDACTNAGLAPQDDAARRWDALLERLRGLGELTVALSGGVDSRFLAHAALRAGTVPHLVHVRGPHVAPTETAYALRWARRQGLSARVLDLDPLALPEVAAGHRERCYACKSFLFRRIADCARGALCDGSNASDGAQFRPGLRALRELCVLSPLAEAGLTKDDIRRLGRQTGLEWPGQQSRACLLTRLPYGMPPEPGLLARLAEGERAVEGILHQAGLADAPFRLRVSDTDCYELHVAAASLPRHVIEQLIGTLHGMGFPSSTVRCMSAVSGYFDAAGPARNSHS
ncbi:ATP-dependent sacrificial sulfur transferase LarE [Desulfomicrobium salsuginis]